MKKWFVLLFAVMLSVSLCLAGCSGGSKDKESTDTAQTESADKGADKSADKAAVEESADQADEEVVEEDMAEDIDEDMEEEAEESVETEYTMEDFCTKVMDATDDMANGMLDQATLDQSLADCISAGEAYKDTPNSRAAISALVGHLMSACGELEGQEFLTCYSEEVMAASEAAHKAAMGVE